MTCKACVTRGKTWVGSDPKCGFENSTFSPDNWNCATASLIRDVAELEGNSNVQHAICDSDERYSTINVSEINDAIALWVNWYKRRGRTRAMWLLFENTPPRQPTEEECLTIIEHYKE